MGVQRAHIRQDGFRHEVGPHKQHARLYVKARVGDEPCDVEEVPYSVCVILSDVGVGVLLEIRIEAFYCVEGVGRKRGLVQGWITIERSVFRFALSRGYLQRTLSTFPGRRSKPHESTAPAEIYEGNQRRAQTRLGYPSHTKRAPRYPILELEAAHSRTSPATSSHI